MGVLNKKHICISTSNCDLIDILGFKQIVNGHKVKEIIDIVKRVQYHAKHMKISMRFLK